MTELLTLTEVADMLRLPPGTLRAWRCQGVGPDSFKIGRRVVYRRSAVDAYIAAQEAAETERVR